MIRTAVLILAIIFLISRSPLTLSVCLLCADRTISLWTYRSFSLRAFPLWTHRTVSLRSCRSGSTLWSCTSVSVLIVMLSVISAVIRLFTVLWIVYCRNTGFFLRTFLMCVFFLFCCLWCSFFLFYRFALCKLFLNNFDHIVLNRTHVTLHLYILL